MSGVEQVFFAIGVFTSIVGALAVCGLIAWQGLEWWIKAKDLFGLLAAFYLDKLKKARGTHPG